MILLYDLREPGTLELARRHRAFWGRLYVDIHYLDNDHLALVFHSAGARWAPWEEVRRRWILNTKGAANAR